MTQRRGILRAVLLSVPLAVFACATQPDFTYYSDMDGGEASAPVADGHVVVDSSMPDATVGDDGSPPADDASDDGMADDGSSIDAAADTDAGSLDASDGAVEVGCGPLDSPSNCGACGLACDTAHSDGAACSVDAGAGLCTYQACSAGFADCDASAPNANGCETPITTVTNCGGCGVACNTANSVDAGCGATGCTYACAPGFADCDPTPPDLNGCSTPTTTAANCGACGAACSTVHSVDAGCGAAGCTYACAPGWSNCNTTSAASNTGGCACNTPACCALSGSAPSAGGAGYACETTHSTGVGQPFYDCEPAGTYNQAQATEACGAYAASIGAAASACQYPAVCSYTISGVTYHTTYDAVFYLSGTTGYVWAFATASGATGGDVYPASTFCSGHPGAVAWQ